MKRTKRSATQNSAAFGRYLEKQERRADWRKEVAQITTETFASKG